MGDEKEKNKNLPEVVRPREELMPQLVDPEEQIKWGQRAAKALVSVISTKKKPVMMNGEQYLEYEDWQVLARFYNYTVGTESTKEVVREGKVMGFEAKAVVRNMTGSIVSSADASCLRDEPNWKIKPEFQLKSMAQTRACAKALRNVLAWVVILAGYRPTPAEEMNDISPATNGSKAAPIVGEFGEPIPPRASPSPAPPGRTAYFEKCQDCRAALAPVVAKYSHDHFNMNLCQKCQVKYKKIR